MQHKEKSIEKIIEKKPVIDDFAKKEIQKNLKRLNQKLSDTESIIAKLEREKASKETILADSAIFNDSVALKRENESYQKILNQLEEVNDEWEEVMLEMEELEGSLV